MSLKKTIIFWGTYDTGKPRVRLLVQGAQHLGYKTEQIHSHVWDGIEDKSQLNGIKNKLIKILQILLVYPGLIYRYLKSPKHEHVIVPYLGAIDVILLWPWAKLRGARIHWDVFLSLYDTVVNDRKMLSQKNPLALLLYGVEWLASRLADNCFLDTPAHAQYFKFIYKLNKDNVQWIPVGVETKNFPRVKKLPNVDLNNIKVFFYGQFIPLHGIDTILDAAALDHSGNIDWLLVGKGQLSDKIDQRIINEKLDNIHRIEWVEYKKLTELIQQSDICLGIFGQSEKAKSVIPNKIYQIMATGKAFISAQSSGIAPLELEKNVAVRLIEPGNAPALLAAVNELANKLATSPHEVFEATRALPIVGINEVAEQLKLLLDRAG
jgi:glycosyltransferase involved in cell wall biosynthesis